MKVVVFTIGILIAIQAVIFLIKPIYLAKTVKFFSKGRLIYIPALFKAVIGIVFLVFARECRYPWVIIIIGILLSAGGISVFIIKFETIKTFLNWWVRKSSFIHRLWAIVICIFAGLIIWAGLPK